MRKIFTLIAMIAMATTANAQILKVYRDAELIETYTFKDANNFVFEELTKVTSITLSKTSAEIDSGSSLQLTATVMPTDATFQSVKWESSNTYVATVNDKGLVTALSAGTATITATATDGSGTSAACTVTVKSQGPVPFVKGQKVTLTATVDAPGNAADVKTRVSGTVSGGTLSFTWSAGDALTVTVGGASTIFTMKSGAGTAEATFEGIMPADGTTFDACFGPSSIPTIQTYSGANMLPANAMPFKATGCTVGNSLRLLGQSSVLNLYLYGESITTKKITVKQDGGNTYTLNCGGGITLGTTAATATPLYIVVPAGSYKFTIEIYDNATMPTAFTSFSTSSAQSFTTDKYIIMPPRKVKVEYVDLGLSVKWAIRNIGAEKPEDYGDYFAWGETTGYNSGKSNFSWSTYKWCNGSYNSLTKYCTSSSYGTVDNKTVLDAADDAATTNWGSGWKMPTHTEWQELIDNCTWTWTQVNGINGYKVTSNKSGYTDKSIFLPAAGFRCETYIAYAGDSGNYWSSSLYTYDNKHASDMGFLSRHISTGNNDRYSGRCIRPVRTK